jgi:histidinol-phosphate aminotransferase
MSRTQPRSAPARRALLVERPIRMDTLSNPYGPSVFVQEAIAGTDELHLAAADRELRFHLRLANQIGHPPDGLLLGNGLAEIIDGLLLRQQTRGPVLVFPPTDPAVAERATQYRIDVTRFARAGWFGLEVTAGDLAGLPAGVMAYVQHPNDPSGTLLGNQSLVRLTRRCDVVVVDERHAGYGGRSFAPLVREFDNLIVLQSFETWAGLAGMPFAYAIAPPALVGDLRSFLRPGGVTTGAILAATASLDDFEYVRATAGRVREERSRLYRMLRKLNVVRPIPSAANFVLARVERGTASLVARELAERDIRVHRPADPQLAEYLRISAVNAESTDALKRALIEIAAWL